MSLVGTPFSEAGTDGFLPSIEQENDLYGGYRRSFEGDGTPFFSSPLDNDTFDDLNLGLNDERAAPSNSRSGSGTATPHYEEDVCSPEFELTGYNLQQTHVYPGPDDLDGGAHPYPLQHQTPQALYQKTSKRPLPYRSATNANMGYVPNALQNFHDAHHPAHRRSWSHNDTERIANMPLDQYPPGVRHQPPFVHHQPHANTNPTFVRLCETRHSRSATKLSSEYKKPHHTQGRTWNRGKSQAPTSMSIGTPLPFDHGPVPTAGNVQLTGPKLMHMSHADQRKSSQRIIEVGAMAVVSKARAQDKLANIDPSLLGEDARNREKSSAPSPESSAGASEPREKMLKELDRMEKLLKDCEGKEADKVLKGCEMIREALAKTEDTSGGDRAEGKGAVEGKCIVVDSNPQTSSPVSSDADSPLSDGNEELMRQWVGNSPSPN